MDVALKKGADKVCADAKARCPVGTRADDPHQGALKQSIHVLPGRKGELRYIVVSDAKATDSTYYGKIVEFSPKINRPYLYPAMDENQAQITENIRLAFQDACKRK